MEENTFNPRMRRRMDIGELKMRLVEQMREGRGGIRDGEEERGRWPGEKMAVERERRRERKKKEEGEAKRKNKWILK